MKAKINNDNKAKFFSLYMGQMVLKTAKTSKLEFLNKHWNWSHPEFHLLLKPLSQISDEDAVEVAKTVSQYSGKIEISERINGGIVFLLPFVSEKLLYRFKNLSWYKQYYTKNEFDSLYKYPVDRHLSVCDYLRSRGYALPWMGISVEEMIESGWIKLKEK